MEEELIPNTNTEEDQELKNEEFINEINKEEDDEDDPEVTLDYILDGLVDSGKIDWLSAEEKHWLLERLQKLTKKVNSKIRILEK